LIADYATVKGNALLICMNDAEGMQGLQRGFVESSDFKITALYPTQELADAAAQRIREAKLGDRMTCAVGTVEALPFDEGSFDLIAGTGPMMLWGDREKKMREVHRVLRPSGVAFIGGKFLGMPQWRKVSSDTLRASAAATGLPGIRVLDDGGQWIEIIRSGQGRWD